MGKWKNSFFSKSISSITWSSYYRKQRFSRNLIKLLCLQWNWKQRHFPRFKISLKATCSTWPLGTEVVTGLTLCVSRSSWSFSKSWGSLTKWFDRWLPYGMFTSAKLGHQIVVLSHHKQWLSDKNICFIAQNHMRSSSNATLFIQFKLEWQWDREFYQMLKQVINSKEVKNTQDRG